MAWWLAVPNNFRSRSHTFPLLSMVIMYCTYGYNTALLFWYCPYGQHWILYCQIWYSPVVLELFSQTALDLYRQIWYSRVADIVDVGGWTDNGGQMPHPESQSGHNPFCLPPFSFLSSSSSPSSVFSPPSLLLSSLPLSIIIIHQWS